MKKYFLISILIFSAISFTGCGTKNISYEKYSIERDLNNNIGKIDKSVKLIDSSEQKVIRKLGNKSYSFRTYELEASDMNKEISKEFFNQYFTMNQNSENVFTVNSKIKDFVIRNTANPNNSNAEVEVEFTVIKDNKTILNKIYRKESLGNTIFEIRLTTEEITFRKLQKTVLSIYENEFKSDLLKALKENK